MTKTYPRWFFILIFSGLLVLFYIFPLDQRINSLGDDFAQYIQHAQNISHGYPYNNLPYLYNPEAPISPPVYPPIYPLLISPLTFSQTPPYFWIKAVSVLLFLLTLPVLYQIFRSLSGISLVKETLLLYTIIPWVVFGGRDIVAEPPYIFFSVLALWSLMTLPGNRLAVVPALLTGLCMALAALTRDIGLALWGGSVLFYSYKIWKNPPQRSIALFQIIILSFTFLIPVFLWNWYQNEMGLGPVNKIYFQISLGLNNLSFNGLVLRFISNLYYYSQKGYELLFPLSYILHPVPYLNWLRFPLTALILFILLWQMIKGLRGSAMPILLYISGFLGILLLLDFPMRAGVRYIIPLAPFLTFFLLKGVKEFFSYFGRPASSYLYKIFLIFWIGLSIWGSGYFLFSSQSPLFSAASPENPAYRTTISWIRKELPEDCRIAYIKPRYLALYSHKPTVIPTLTKPPNQIINQLSCWKVTHVLLDDHFLKEESSLRKALHQSPHFFSPLYTYPPLSLFTFKGPTCLTGDILPSSGEN